MTLNPWWANWSDFAAMGGYGLYVWGSFGVGALAVVAETVSLHWRRKALRHSADDKADDDVPGKLESMR